MKKRPARKMSVKYILIKQQVKILNVHQINIVPHLLHISKVIQLLVHSVMYFQ